MSSKLTLRIGVVLLYIFSFSFCTEKKEKQSVEKAIEKTEVVEPKINSKPKLIDIKDIELIGMIGNDSIGINPSNNKWDEIRKIDTKRLKLIEVFFKNRHSSKDLLSFEDSKEQFARILIPENELALMEITKPDVITFLNNIKVGDSIEELVRMKESSEFKIPKHIKYITIGYPYLANKGLELFFKDNKLIKVAFEYLPDGELKY